MSHKTAIYQNSRRNRHLDECNNHHCHAILNVQAVVHNTETTTPTSQNNRL